MLPQGHNPLIGQQHNQNTVRGVTTRNGTCSLRSESLGNDLAHVEEPLRAVGQAGGFAGAELAPRGTCYALVPALAR